MARAARLEDAEYALQDRGEPMPPDWRRMG
jgi:hypothetical protein